MNTTFSNDVIKWSPKGFFFFLYFYVHLPVVGVWCFRKCSGGCDVLIKS